MTHNYKFYYFDVRGRGEVIRLLFHLDNVKFVDERIGMEEWPALKAEMPLNQVPVLDIDGVKIGETTAIARFIGHQLRRAGSNPIECAKLDMIAEVIQSFLNKIGKWPPAILGMIKEDKNQIFKDTVIPAIETFAPLVEKFLLENGNNGLFSGDRETWVDVFAAESFVKIIDYGSPDALDAYPHILSLINRIFNIPSIKKYVASRKATPI
ncbi:unnamed protein product [Caenorhabditis bovis]|uniref:glutathione transferase n=1 Tax=Caenorhabditis bovis TaxID=2654633 RepID=A0A8S1ELY9_9PELO|nr:unnamed protein product [Caenorhabditis bovis]